jgi:hypothetical protein
MSKIDEWEWDNHPAELLEMGYEVYLERLFESLIVTEDAEGEGDVIEPMDTESGTYFCGCDTCCTRETLAFLLPRILDLYEQGYIRKRVDA